MATETRKTGIDAVGDVVAWVPTFVCSMRPKRISWGLDFILQVGIGKRRVLPVDCCRALDGRSGTASRSASLDRYLADSRLEIMSGLSLLTRDGKRPDAYGKASIGQLSPACGVRTSEVGPPQFRPCGDVLDQNRTLLFRHFERHYLYSRPATPLAEEGLLVPFYVNGKAAGTLWTIAHNDSRKFNAEDLRPLQSLGRFASAGIAVTTIRQRGQFELRTRTDTHLRDGEFNKDKTLAFFEAVVKNSKEQGFAVIRFVTHMEWASENRQVDVSSSLCAKPEE